MILYRIGNCKHITDLNGFGAQLYGGRWNSIGRPMVYLTSSRSLAVLEVLVHTSVTQMPFDACIIEVEVPEDVQFMPDDWQSPTPPIILQQFGDLFLKREQSLLMKVPSAIVKEEHNYLLNPRHPKASSVKIIKNEPFSFDSRLLKHNK
jgi:RES domain-containing protein